MRIVRFIGLVIINTLGILIILIPDVLFCGWMSMIQDSWQKSKKKGG
jgi:hypothetical protein